MNQTQPSELTQQAAESLRGQRWSERGVPLAVKVAILGALLVWFFYIEISRTVHRWTADPSWSHGFLIPAFSLY